MEMQDPFTVINQDIFCIMYVCHWMGQPRRIDRYMSVGVKLDGAGVVYVIWDLGTWVRWRLNGRTDEIKNKSGLDNSSEGTGGKAIAGAHC